MTELIIARVQLVAVFIICGWSLWKGGLAERLGSSVLLANTLLGVAIAYVLGPTGNPVVKLTLDGLTAFVFVALTIRFTSNWLGAVMLLCGAQFALNAFYFVMEKSRDQLYVKTNNAIFLFVCISLAAGVIGHLRAQKALAHAT